MGIRGKLGAVAPWIILSCLPAYAQTPVIPQIVNGGGTSGPITYCNVGTTATGTCAMPVAGTFSVSGFTPNGNYANLTATGSSARVALPTGTVVVAYNTGTTAVSCVLGNSSVTATTNEDQIAPGGFFSYTVGSNADLACIDQTGSASNVVVLSGGAGIASGAGGGSNGGSTNATIVGPLGTQTLGNSVAVTTGNGNDVAEGSTTDNPSTGCPNSTSAGTAVACLKQIAANTAGSVPAGSAIIGKVGIDQTTPGTTNGVQVNAALPAGTNLMGKVGIDQTTVGTTNGVTPVAATSGGLSWSTFEPAASDNHTNLKNGAGQVYEITAFNNSATINYIRLYNAASGFNGCNSATNLVAVFHIPANTSDAGYIYRSDFGIPFSTGISYCVVSAYGQTATTNATASAMDINIGYR